MYRLIPAIVNNAYYQDNKSHCCHNLNINYIDLLF